MEQSVKDQLKREKDLKSKLVETRNIIQNKFEKAYKHRIHKERKLKEKYKPITSSIDKLSKQQNLLGAKPGVEKYNKYISSPRFRNFGRRSSLKASRYPKKANIWNENDLALVNYAAAPIFDVNANANLSDQNLHSQHHDPPGIPSIQHIADYDNLDGAGPSNASNRRSIDFKKGRNENFDDDDDMDSANKQLVAIPSV